MPRVRRCKAQGCHALAQLPHSYCTKHAQLEATEKRKTYSRARYNRVARNRSITKQEQYKFYKSRTWRSLRRFVLDSQHYLCQYCLAQGKLTPNSKTVDHIVPIEADPRRKADIENLATICRACHNAKTKWEQSYYGTGQDNELKKVLPITKIAQIVKMMERESQEKNF